MDPTYAPEAEAFRERIRAFLAEHLPEGWNGIGALPRDEVRPFVEQWRKTLHADGLLAPSWPKELDGGGLSPLEQVIMAEEFTKVGVPAGTGNDVFGIQMVGNTILQWGTPEQKSHFIPRIMSGQDVWCQGYSEPNAGSDLANLGCRADLDGDEWVINGQKIWTSGGHLANWIFVLARTAPDAAKHKGISFLLVPMDQPGIEVRPIAMLSGESEFNEVFFTDARCPKENVLGEVNGGWAVAMFLLGYERGEAAATFPVMFRAELDRLVALAQEHGRADDPLIRQRLVWCHSKVEIMRYLGMKTLTAFLRGEHPGPDSAIFKLYWSEYHKIATELAVDILGPDAMVPSGRWPVSSFQTDAPGAPNDSASWVGVLFNARAGTIYAGTSQVQRNIIGEMVLGLPKEPRPTTPSSWRDDQRSIKEATPARA
ncbi:MAG: acyl-CoA dehydrogenase family protein [Actinomycetota bacterium]|nr:acyl-CoA dehydrogenase family protein [Actinomycetota bacterium]